MRKDTLEEKLKFLKGKSKRLFLAIAATATITMAAAEGLSLYNRVERNPFPDPPEYNVVAVYTSKEADPKNSFILFERELREALQDWKEYEKKEVDLEIIRLEPEVPVKEVPWEEADEVKYRLTEELIKKLDSLLTNYAQKKGRIDLAILGFHSSPQSSDLYIFKDDDGDAWEIELRSSDIEELGRNNPLARHVFSENAKVIYEGCSAGRKIRPLKNLAQALRDAYGVNVEAPNQIYQGEVVYNPEAGEFQLSGKNTVVLEEPKNTIKYVSESGEEWLLAFTQNIGIYKEGLIIRRPIVKVQDLSSNKVYYNNEIFSPKSKDCAVDSVARKLAERWAEKYGELRLPFHTSSAPETSFSEIKGFRKVEGPENISHFLKINKYEKPSKLKEYLLEMEEDFRKLKGKLNEYIALSLL